LLLVVSMLAAACGGPSVAGSAPAGSTSGSQSVAGSKPPAPSASAAALVDIDVDACSFIDTATVQALTGVSENFATQAQSQPSGSSCFWGATVAGVPGYVELSIFRQHSLADYAFGDGCDVTPITGVAVEAAFVDCPPDPQHKVSMLAFERGVIVSVLVNEPAGPVGADDLGPVIESVFGQLH
jgi:hypothetical protein